MKKKSIINKDSVISDIVSAIESGAIPPEEAMEMLNLRISQNSFAEIDHNRSSRCGFPEFIFGEGKTVEQLKRIVAEIAETEKPVLITRISENFAESLLDVFPDALYDTTASIFLSMPDGFKADKGNALIITAGTTDLPAAMEAEYTLKACGCRAELIADAGVAGIHRVLSKVSRFKKADVIIVVAGMEGALPSVVGGLVSCPVIALPTSVGYGTALGGMTAMFSMLNSCANGVTVMNIDNGFGAGCAAARIINSKE